MDTERGEPIKWPAPQAVYSSYETALEYELKQAADEFFKNQGEYESTYSWIQEEI